MANSRRSTRIKACELAAQVMSMRPDDAPAPLVWSLSVFFEMYIDGGATATRREFGPKRPVKLKAVWRG